MAADIGDESEHADWKPVAARRRHGRSRRCPNGSVGFRYGEQGKGRWNLRPRRRSIPCSPCTAATSEAVEVALPRFDVGDGPGGGVMRRGVPAIRVGGRLVTTVLDLMLATYGVARDGLPGEWPEGYDDARAPYTPAWQEAITSVDRRLAVKVAREFARNAEVSGGRSMICMGAGTNHWFHSDETYRSFIALLLLGGCVGINGGGWAHYVGQEKIRTFAGWQTLAFALDWRRPPRQAQGTSWFYQHTEQWRYDRLRPERFASPLGAGLFEGHDGDRRARQGGADGLDAVVPDVRPQPARARRRGRRRRASTRPSTSWPSSRRAAWASRSTTRARRRASRACSSSGARTCSAPRARARSTSCATCSAPSTTGRWPSRCPRASARRACAGARRSRAASSTCWSTSTSA